MSSTVDMANEEAVPYAGPKPYGMSDDVITLGALDLDCDERLWVPQSKDVNFRPLLLSASRAASSTCCGCGAGESCHGPPRGRSAHVHAPGSLALP